MNAAVVRLIILVAYVVQIGLLCVARVPGPRAISDESRAARRTVWARRVISSIRGVPAASATVLVWLLTAVPLFAVIAPRLAEEYLGVTFRSGGIAIPGCVLVATGTAIDVAACVSLKRHTGFDRFGEADRLVTSGPFRWIRNPITTGLTLIYAGFLLTMPSLLVALGMAAFIVNAAFRVPREERGLEAKFGESYRRYRRNVGAFIPRRSYLAHRMRERAARGESRRS